MSSNTVETTSDLPHVEASIPDVPQVEPSHTSPPLPEVSLPEHPKGISFAELPPPPETIPSPTQPTSPLLFPVALSLAGKTGVTLADLVTDLGNNSFITPDIAATEMVVAADGSFVDTPSGSAARGFKKYLDQQYGVSIQVRSPYTITGFINQHGQQRYRVGLREQTAPAASAPEFEEPVSSRNTISKASPDSYLPNQKRRSRMSMSFLPPVMFKNGSISGRPHTSVTQSSGTKKPRKTRSIPDLATFGEGSQRPKPSINISTRIHSQSVTSTDTPPYLRNAQPDFPFSGRGDIFGQVMDWCSPDPLSNSHSSQDGSQATFEDTHPSFQHPFGLGVAFDSPSLKQPLDFLPPPRQLQEKNSFESTQTARQLDPHPPPTRDSAISLVTDGPSEEPTRPTSALDYGSSALGAELPAEEEDGEYTLSSELTMLTQYSTKVFDVLQTYRGLPLLDRFSPDTVDTTVIKLSLSADDTAAPRDDPRFVIWGGLLPDWDHDDRSTSRDSFTDASIGPSSSLSKRRSKARARQSDASRASMKGIPTRKVLLAATIERWIAQLTSDLNYDELLNFFLTYRTYVSAIDLCQLLICRFHWALQEPTSPHDEKVRRIVRVRTFVAIRYWLLTFFIVDFLPNRELRILISNWLNALHKDPVLRKNTDGVGIVKRLIKVAKECRQAHTQASSSKPKSSPSKEIAHPQDHVLGKKFAEIVTKKALEEEGESDLDLDFLPEEARVPESNGNNIANAHISVATNVTSGISPTRPTPLPLSSLSILHRTDHAPGPASSSDSSHPSSAPVLPIQQSALSRAFVKTIGRLGRWTRVLNSRSVNRSPLSACADVSAFDLDLNVTKDLLAVNGGVEKYLKAVEAKRQEPLATGVPPKLSISSLPPPSPPQSIPSAPAALQIKRLEPAPDQATEDVATPVLSHFKPSIPPTNTSAQPETLPPEYAGSTQVSTSPPPDDAVDPQPEVPEPSLPPADYEHELIESSDRPISMRTTSTDSFGVPLSEIGQPPTFPTTSRSQWQFDVASLDDLDLSDSSSDAHIPGPAAPPGLKKPSRKLPLRRDFEFAPRPETVSSLGIASRASVASGPSSTVVSSASVQGLGGNIQQWQMNALVDSLSDDGEVGDVEAALRRLEGHISPERVQEKVSKVNGWVRTIQERMVTGDYGDEESRFPLGSDEEDEEGNSISFGDESESQNDQSVSTPPTSEPNESDVTEDDNQPDLAHTPIPGQMHNVTLPQNSNHKPSLDVAIPLEILQSRVSASLAESEADMPISKFGGSTLPRLHRSFVLGVRAEVLAQHFSMIDRELFMGVKFEELVLDDWAGTEEIDILDWMVYLKERARWKSENRFPEKTSALAAVRARFNLTANFVVSEIVLTQPSERPTIVGKFVRIAWKCYEQSNFHTLTAIVAALQTPWVKRAMSKSAWHRIGIFETRVLKDLKQFAANIDNFKFIRQATDAIAESKPLETSTASVVSSGEGKGKHTERSQGTSACIPFIGVYLSQLHQLGRLPDLIDPTAPHQTVGISPVTSAFEPLAQPEVFSSLAPLPNSMHLEPLINVHKQRRIAEVIKSLVAGQHLASRVQFEVDKKLFNRCLRLRTLDTPTLQRVLAMYSG